MTLDGSQVNIFIAFWAGFLTFFASCVMPLVPTYLAYLSGVSLNDPEAGHQRWHVFKMGALFVFGFVLTFVLLGLTLNQLSATLAPVRWWMERLAGVLFIALGLFMLGIFKSTFFAQERKLDLHRVMQKQHHLHAILTGIAFGFGWTPCIGPVLAVILFWASRQATEVMGTLLLISYGIGLGVPFLIIALGFEKVIPWLKANRKISYYANIISGSIVLLVGILLLFNQFDVLSLWLLRVFNLQTLSF